MITARVDDLPCFTAFFVLWSLLKFKIHNFYLYLYNNKVCAHISPDLVIWSGKALTNIRDHLHQWNVTCIQLLIWLRTLMKKMVGNSKTEKLTFLNSKITISTPSMITANEDTDSIYLISSKLSLTQHNNQYSKSITTINTVI